MKILLLAMMTASAFGTSFTMDVSCGELKRVGNAELHERLVPRILPIRTKFGLKTIMKNTERMTITGSSESNAQEVPYHTDNDRKVITRFADKQKFKNFKQRLKSEIKASRKLDQPLYACVGRVNVGFLKVIGAHVTTSNKSLEAAREAFKNKAFRHL